jgi:hypothetical protein
MHWWKAKVCLLSLHTRGQQPKDNTYQNVYMVALFVSFGAKSLSSGTKFVRNIDGSPSSSQVGKLFLPN